MQFHSEHTRHCAALFHTVSFGEARQALLSLLKENPDPRTRTEALALLLRINIERDETTELEEMARMAEELGREARAFGLQAARYHLGIVNLLADAVDAAERCFTGVEGAEGAYGIAAVLHKRRESAAAIGVLHEARKANPEADLNCLMWLLESNCQKGLSQIDAALTACQEAQKLLPIVRTFYLKHWVLFGLATVHARRGDNATATTLLEVVLSITPPVDFKRLHRLASAEMMRVDSSAEILLDPVTGDLSCGRGYLSFRRKPTLINLLSNLIRAWPDPVTKETIYRRVWGGEYHPLRHDGLIYSHMQRLRQILATDERLKDFVLTTQDGYRLNPDIRVKLKEDPYETHPSQLGVGVSR